MFSYSIRQRPTTYINAIFSANPIKYTIAPSITFNPNYLFINFSKSKFALSIINKMVIEMNFKLLRKIIIIIKKLMNGLEGY